MSVLGRFERLLDERVRMQERSIDGATEPRAWERTVQLADALAAMDRMRTMLLDGFNDRDRGFEYALARLPNASPDRERAERAEAALAERTLQLAEALALSSARADAFAEGLADRDLRIAAIEALSEKRLRSEALRHAELRDEMRRMQDRLDARSVQLAESLIAAQRSHATMLAVLLAYGEAFAFLRARLEEERRRTIEPPNVVRRFVRALKRRLPSPLSQVALGVRSRVRRY